MPKLPGNPMAMPEPPVTSRCGLGKRAERQQIGIGDRVGDDQPFAIALGKAQRGLGAIPLAMSPAEDGRP